MINEFFESNMEFVYLPFPCLCDYLFFVQYFTKSWHFLLSFLLFFLLEDMLKNWMFWLSEINTYVHDVPHLVQKWTSKFKINLFFKVFIKRIWNIFYSLNYDEHTEPGWTLEQHTNSEITLEKIRQGGWDVVILQVYRYILGLIYKKYDFYDLFVFRKKASIHHLEKKIYAT